MILNSPYISGSLTVTGNIISSGSITISGSIASASYASNAERVDGLDSTSFVFTSSYNTDSASVSTRVTKIEGNYATTGSNVFMGAQTVCANITSTGTIIAQTLNVQQVTSSIVYSSGSNIFGCLPSNVQQMTGSLRVTGSGNHWFQAGCVGIGTTTPTARLHVGAGNQTPINGADTKIHIADATLGGRAALLTLASNCAGVCVEGQFESSAEIFADSRVILGSTSNHPIAIRTNNLERLRITNAGIACFSARVCAPSLTVSTTNAVLTIQGTSTPGEAQVDLEGKNSSGTVRSAIFKYDSSDIIRLGTSSNITMRFETNDTTRLCIMNTGIAVFACQVCLPTSNTSLVAGTYGTISNTGGIDTNIGNNAYYDGTNWRRFAAQEAARILINRDSFTFLRKASDGAGSCISWDNTLVLASSGIACFTCQVCAPAFISTGTSRLDSLILTKSSDPQICSATNVGLNIDGYALYLNRNSNSNVSILENETGASYTYIGKSWSATNHRINLQVPQGCVVLVISGYSCVSNDSVIFQAAKGTSANTAAATVRVTCNDSTGRSINAGGSINANGSDYAEYITKRTDTGYIQKGQIAGIDVCKLLTDKWSLACSFVVKSTSPSYVGGDEWSLPLGEKPTMKVGDDPELFLTCLAEFEARLEEARQKVDRIAFSGQVPVIISGSYNIGDYVLPIEGPDDTIIGVACPLSSLSLTDYGRTVGKIWGSCLDKAWIAVKIG